MEFRCYCFQKPLKYNIYIYIYILFEVYLNQAQTELDRGSTIENPVD